MVLTSCWRCACAYISEPFSPSSRPTTNCDTPCYSSPDNRPAALVFILHNSGIPKNILVKKKRTSLQTPTKQKAQQLSESRKKAFVKPVKDGGPGERRVQGKKLVLASVNGTPVELPKPTAKIAVEEDCNGSMFVFDWQMIDTLKGLEVFQLKQGWGVFYKPSTLVRKESIELGRLIVWVNGEEIPTKRWERRGRKGCSG